MGWKWPLRRRNEPENSAPQKDYITIDPSVPRRCIRRSFSGQPGPCPECGGALRQSHQTYVVVTRHGQRITDPFIIGSDFGWFCAVCPVVVINSTDVNRMLSSPLPHWDVGSEFVVLGIVDLDAVPEDKRHVPFGEDDNPIPLVRFSNLPTPRPKRARKKLKKRRRRRR